MTLFQNKNHYIINFGRFVNFWLNLPLLSDNCKPEIADKPEAAPVGLESWRLIPFFKILTLTYSKTEPFKNFKISVPELSIPISKTPMILSFSVMPARTATLLLLQIKLFVTGQIWTPNPHQDRRNFVIFIDTWVCGEFEPYWAFSSVGSWTIVCKFEALCKFVNVLLERRDVKLVVEETLECCWLLDTREMLVFGLMPVVGL